MDKVLMYGRMEATMKVGSRMDLSMGKVNG